MNNTTDSSVFHSSSINNINSYGYGIAFSIGIIVLILTISLISYFCTRTQILAVPTPTTATLNWTRHVPVDVNNFIEPQQYSSMGLDEATILSYPKLLYSEASKVKKTLLSDSTATCCTICLADYKGSDMLRVLPDCSHQFHLKCIDPWLRLHPTCPVCRTSPFPTPLSTPMAEVVPLARS
ncbi:hypothetical protein RIF29_39600 [Crotalaria pallida]|uniref:RING-type domain-containing protein n=1 Tax=Crotalaria pallida TaxID=3830 RepID=A0AAN9E1G8_CROPI